MNRDELRRQARHLIVGCPGCDEDTCIYCPVPGRDATLDQLMELIDQHVDSILTSLDDQELWTATEVAKYRNLSTVHSARALLSYYKIRAVRMAIHPETKRPMALYSADEVRALPARKATAR